MTGKKKTARPRQGQNAGITVKMYEAIYREFLADQNPTRIARHLGVDPRTVRKYVDRGDPLRGMRPIRERFVEVLEKVQQQEDTSAATALAENLALVRECKKVLAAKFHEHLAADGKSLTPRASEELPADVSGSLEKIIRLEFYLLGQPDSRVEMLGKYEGWTREQLMDFLKTRKRPRQGGGGAEPNA